MNEARSGRRKKENNLQEFLEDERGNYGLLTRGDEEHVRQRNIVQLWKSRAISTSELSAKNLPFADPNSYVQAQPIVASINDSLGKDERRFDTGIGKP